MLAPSALPGLDRLIAVCQQHSLVLKLSTPLASAPWAGELVLGDPFDPQLAAVYARLGSAEFGPLALYGPHSGEQGLIPENKRLREYDFVHTRSTLVFGWEPGYSYYYGTVPQLANGERLQPVVHIVDYEEKYAIPIASSVDRFFHLFSRYLELLVADPGYGQPFAKVINFPSGMMQLIAEDEPLMEQVLAGRFDFLADNEPDALEWLHELRLRSRLLSLSRRIKQDDNPL
jgi:hypothetical protein